MEPITFADFERVEIRAGTVREAAPFPEAQRPALRLLIDLGAAGCKRSSAQITAHYAPEDLLGRQVLCVCNFPPKQIGPVRSEVLVLGLVPEDGSGVVLVHPERPVRDGTRLA